MLDGAQRRSEHSSHEAKQNRMDDPKLKDRAHSCVAGACIPHIGRGFGSALTSRSSGLLQ